MVVVLTNLKLSCFEMSFSFGVGSKIPSSVSSSPSLFGASVTTVTKQEVTTTITSSAPGFGLTNNAGFASTASTPNTGFSFGSNVSVVGSEPNSITGSKVPQTTGGALFGITTSAATSTTGPSSGNLPTLSFGKPTASGVTCLSSGLTNPVTANTNVGLGSSSFAVTSAVNTTTGTVGLGGIATSQVKTGGAVSTQKEVSSKDQPLPNEILQTVENFKGIVKQQKLFSSDIAKCSVRDFRKVEQEIDIINNSVSEIESQLRKNRQIAEKLKYDAAKALQNIEIAQRTHDTPAGLQYENTGPQQFFIELADQFEREMQALKIHIENADKYVRNFKNPNALTSQDLAMGMKRLHETFVALAGRLQSVHNQVESQKENYVKLRKCFSNDSVDPFENLYKLVGMKAGSEKNIAHSAPKVGTGPTPFTSVALNNINPSVQHSAPPPPYPGLSTPGGFGATNLGAQGLGNQSLNTSQFGNTSFGQSSFQLQKPPSGNKRGKM